MAGVTRSGFVHPGEVVVDEVQRDGVRVVLRVLAERIRETRKAPNGHTHRQILPLHE